MAIFKNTRLKGVIEIIRDPLYEDHRGLYDKTFALSEYKDILGDTVFVEDGISTSYQSVLRGIHGNATTAKLVFCVRGYVYNVVVNNDPESDQYLQWQAFSLSAINCKQLYIPPKFGNSYLVISDSSIYSYKLSAYYTNMSEQFTLRWDDPKLGILWPIDKPVLSIRDAEAPFLK